MQKKTPMINILMERRGFTCMKHDSEEKNEKEYMKIK